MKSTTLILTLCAALVGTAVGQSFTEVTPNQFRNGHYSVVAWADVDGDGNVDLFLGSSFNTGSKLFLNDGRNWTDASSAYDVDEITRVRSARFVDFDADGRMDLFCLTGNADGAELYRLNSNLRFQRVVLNLEQMSDAGIRSATWCDADQDGSLDLLFSNRSSSSDGMVLLTQVAQEYAEQRAGDGPLMESNVAQISPVDFDQDGDLDYFITKLSGEASLWRYEGDSYRNLAMYTDLPSNGGQSGLTWADFNQDGNLDLFVCGSEENNSLFYQRTPNDPREVPWFENMSDAFELRSLTKYAHSAHAVDVNGDGWTDLYLSRSKGLGNVVLINLSGNGWRQWVGGNPLIQPGQGSFSSAWADFDSDGDLDCVMATGIGTVRLFRNNAVLNNEFFGLKLCGPGTCTTPVMDALVEVTFPTGKQWAATSMYASQPGADGMTKYFYNVSSDHSEEYSVSVLWPNGIVTHYTQDQIHLWGINELHMPTTVTPGSHGSAMSMVTRPEVSNYPNPFNPTTNINFTLPEVADINLTVFNLLGQQVAALASGTFEAGSHSLVFDASSLTSGLYLVRLEAPNQSVVHRILLAK